MMIYCQQVHQQSNGVRVKILILPAMSENIQNHSSIKETEDKIVIFGEYNYRFDVPKSKIKQVGRNVILDMEYPELFNYNVDRNVPLPTTGESVVELVNEQ